MPTRQEKPEISTDYKTYEKMSEKIRELSLTNTQAVRESWQDNSEGIKKFSEDYKCMLFGLAIKLSIQSGNIKFVEFLMQQTKVMDYAFANTIHGMRLTPLQLAAWCGSHEIVSLILKDRLDATDSEAKDLEEKHEDNSFAYNLACAGGHKHIMGLLKPSENINVSIAKNRARQAGFYLLLTVTSLTTVLNCYFSEDLLNGLERSNPFMPEANRKDYVVSKEVNRMWCSVPIVSQCIAIYMLLQSILKLCQAMYYGAAAIGTSLFAKKNEAPPLSCRTSALIPTQV